MFTWDSLVAAATSPAVTPVYFFLGAVALHVLFGGLLHLLRLHDFDFHKFGIFVENDFAVARGKAILVTGLTALATSVTGGGELSKSAFLAAWIAFAAACGAATLPILRDTLYDVVQLVSGSRPMSSSSGVTVTSVAVTAEKPTRTRKV